MRWLEGFDRRCAQFGSEGWSGRLVRLVDKKGWIGGFIRNIGQEGRLGGLLRKVGWKGWFAELVRCFFVRRVGHQGW